MALDDAFFPVLRTAASQMGVPPQWLLSIFYLESRFQPSAHRPGSNFYGLNQLSGSVIRAAGADPADYLTWSASEQMRVIGPWYARTVRDYLRDPPPRSPGVLYALNLLPGRVLERGDAQDAVLTQTPERFYLDNAGLDFDRSGAITVGDLDLFLSRLTLEGPYLRELARLDRVAIGPESVVRTVLALGFALSMGVIGALLATGAGRR